MLRLASTAAGAAQRHKNAVAKLHLDTFYRRNVDVWLKFFGKLGIERKTFVDPTMGKFA